MCEERIKKYLIDSLHNKNDAELFFISNNRNSELLDQLIAIALDDESNDARMSAAYWISNFEIGLLRNKEDILLELASDELDAISCYIFIALAKIKSRKGISRLIELRIEPELYWEAQALKYYIE